MLKEGFGISVKLTIVQVRLDLKLVDLLDNRDMVYLIQSTYFA